MSNIKQACTVAGGAKSLAAGIGVPVQSVYFWMSGRRRVPADYCPEIEKLTGVPCEELRPDVDWGFVRSNPRPTTTTQPQEAMQ